MNEMVTSEGNKAVRSAQTEMMISRQAQEVQAAMVVAKKFPRDEYASIEKIKRTCQRSTLAEQAIYSYPKGGQNVSGPSVRLAEALAQNWGNIDYGIIELDQKDGKSEMMAYAWDLETNTRVTKIFNVEHKRDTKKGSYVLTDSRDIYEATANFGARRMRAWVACRWAGLVRPRVIMLENVEEFKTWGPLNRRHHPIKAKQGETFQKFVQQLTDLGYEVQFRELIAADYGAPTMRKRFFMIARCDGKPIVWPEPTHGPADSELVKAGFLKPYVGAYTQLDFSLPCPSIFDTSEEIKEKYGIRAVRPLAKKTMDRIGKGLKKFVIDEDEPFIVDGKMPFLIQYHSYNGNDVRGQKITDPLMTLDGSNRYGLVCAFVSKFYKSGVGQDIREPLHTVTTSPGHFGLVMAYLIKYYGSEEGGHDIRDPLDTLTSKDRFGLVEVYGTKYQIRR